MHFVNELPLNYVQFGLVRFFFCNNYLELFSIFIIFIKTKLTNLLKSVFWFWIFDLLLYESNTGVGN